MFLVVVCSLDHLSVFYLTILDITLARFLVAVVEVRIAEICIFTAWMTYSWVPGLNSGAEAFNGAEAGDRTSGVLDFPDWSAEG